MKYTKTMLLGLTFLFVLTACGGGGGGGGGDDQPREQLRSQPQNSSWDQMNWNESNWK